MYTIGYYPGCSLTGSAKEFDKSLRKICDLLGIKLVEIEDWNCCGATSAHATNHLLSVSLPLLNIKKAYKQGITKILAPCAACYNRLVTAQYELTKNNLVKKELSEFLENDYNSIKVINIIEFFQEIIKEGILDKKVVSLKGLKVACYYGCLLLRPKEIIDFDDSEQPSSMEEIIKITDATPVDWNYKIECCGASHSIAHKDIVVDLIGKILGDAQKHSADIMVVACPMCHSNLDMRQLELRKNEGYKSIPIIYLTELIGLSLGLSPEELGINLHFIESRSVFEKYFSKVEVQL
ncbi:MAG TPA: CoB--CoM heterodisulfide reductase iron-sulfur subunit B family protein [Ignavibacteria bacterium]